MTHDDPNPDSAVHVPGEVRSHLAREGISLTAFAERIDRSPDWVKRRLSARAATVTITLEDLDVIAAGLGLSARDLLPR